jgi:hypothetical protein
MRFLTDDQKIFLVRKKIKVNDFYMFPRMGFNFYSEPDYSKSGHISTNPFTRSLDHEHFFVKEKVGDFCKGNFYHKPSECGDFYITEEELSRRGLIEIVLLSIIMFIPFTLCNLFTNKY